MRPLLLDQITLLIMAQLSKHQYAYLAAHQLRRALTRLLCVLLVLQLMLTQAAPALTPPATLTAGGALTLATQKAGLILQSQDATTLEAPEGPVSLLRTNTDYVQKQRREADLLWRNEQDQGQFKEAVRPVEIEAGRGFRINAGRGVEATFRAWDYARAYQTSQQRAQDLPIETHRYHWHRPYCGIINQTSVSCQSAQAKPKPKPG